MKIEYFHRCLNIFLGRGVLTLRWDPLMFSERYGYTGSIVRIGRLRLQWKPAR